MASELIRGGAAKWDWFELRAPSRQQLSMMRLAYERLLGPTSGEVPIPAASSRERAAMRRLTRCLADRLTESQEQALLHGKKTGHVMLHLKAKGLVKRDAHRPRYTLTWLGSAVAYEVIRRAA